MGEPTKDIPNPGSDEAVARGCTCPVMDNARGAEWMGFMRGFYITEGCPLHSKAGDPSHQDDDGRKR